MDDWKMKTAPEVMEDFAEGLKLYQDRYTEKDEPQPKVIIIGNAYNSCDLFYMEQNLKERGIGVQVMTASELKEIVEQDESIVVTGSGLFGIDAIHLENMMADKEVYEPPKNPKLKGRNRREW